MGGLGFVKVCVRWVPRQLTKGPVLRLSSNVPSTNHPPILTRSDYHVFGPLTEGVRCQHFSDNDEVKQAVKTGSKRSLLNFMRLACGKCKHFGFLCITNALELIKMKYKSHVYPF